jgi:outer membrane protein OmpA-like peptidoglycan-associated protein
MRKALVSLTFILASAFFSFSQTFTLADSNFTVGSYLRTYRILFNLGKADLREESKLYLDTVAAYMLKYDNPAFEISVHADSRGSLQSGTNITQARARCISQYLISKGVPSNRLLAKGYGATKLLVSEAKMNALKTKEEYEQAQQLNRRVEFKIIEINGKEISFEKPVFEVGNYIRGYKIVYDLSKPFRPEDAPILDSLVVIMKNRPALRIEIGNHTDYRGSAEANQKLSKFRSESLADYIVSNGISRERIISTGYGEEKPLKIIDESGKTAILSEQYINTITKGKTKEEYEALMQMNRRVEFKILSI